MPHSFAVLRKDHRAVEELFKQLEDTTERAEKGRTELFAELKELLDQHTEIEETILYPALEKVELTHDATLEAEEEHNVAKTLLAELEASDPTTEHWTAKLTVLRESIEHHVEEEENELFPQAEKALDQDTLAELEEQLNKEKENSDSILEEIL